MISSFRLWGTCNRLCRTSRPANVVLASSLRVSLVPQRGRRVRFCNLSGERLLLGAEGASALDEQEAIRLCQGGDKESFRVLVEKHQDKAYRAACMVLGDPGAAEDVVQDAFLAAWRCIDTFKLGLPFAPWFYKIVVRCAVRRIQSV